MAITFPGFNAVCFVCGEVTPYSSHERYCTCREHRHLKNLEKVSQYVDYFVNKFPAPHGVCTIYNGVPNLLAPSAVSTDPLPSFWIIDGRESGGNFSSVEIEQQSDICASAPVPDLFPYKKFVTACGNATLRNLHPSFFGEVNNKDISGSVLDFSTYNWSHTSKDPRSFAIINVAVDHQIHHLALWSAGNAALSLAIAAAQYNAGVNKNEHIFVHVIVYHGTSSLIINSLRSFGAIVTQVAQSSPQSSLEVYTCINANYKRHTFANRDISMHDYWDVTDGFDGVGVLIYRLLLTQAIKNVKPDYIFLPCGTGNLLIGAYLAMQESNEAQPHHKCKIVAAIPKGINALRDVIKARFFAEFRGQDSETTSWPVAPKTAVSHSALGECLAHLMGSKKFMNGYCEVSDGNLIFSEINCAEQVDIASRLLNSQRRYGQVISVEPSGLIQFSATYKFMKSAIETRERSSVMILGTGSGILGEREHQFLANVANRGS